MKNIILIIVVLGAASFIYGQYKKSLSIKNNNQNQLVENDGTNELREPLVFSEGDYVLVSADQTLIWKGESAIKNHVGTLNINDAQISVTNGLISGFATIDMNSISGDAGEELDNHLKSADFFDVENYPNASISFIENSDKTFTSLLKIKGIEKEIVFNPVFSYENDILSLQVDTTFDRTQWGVMYSSSNLADTVKEKIIDNDISVQTKLNFTKKAA